MVVAEACTEPVLPELAVAVLEYAAQLEAEVALVTRTFADAPDPRSPKPQLNVWPAIEQVPGPL